MLVDAYQRKAQIRFTRVTLRVAADEISPDPVAHKGAANRVDNRRPHHETWDGIVPIADTETEVAGKTPQYAGESAEQDRSLQQSDAEIGRQLGEVACIFVHALIRIDAHRSRTGEPERAARPHPLLLYTSDAADDLLCVDLGGRRIIKKKKHHKKYPKKKKNKK